MRSLLYPLNIGTLATWLSVAGFGSVAVMVPQWRAGPGDAPVTETLLVDEPFTLGDEVSPAAEFPATRSRDTIKGQAICHLDHDQGTGHLSFRSPRLAHDRGTGHL